MHKLIRLIHTPKSEILLLANTFILLNLVRLGLFLLPFSGLNKLLKNIAISIWLKLGQREKIEVAKILHAVHTSSYYVFGNPKCLAKALTTQTLMKAFGYRCDLKIGVMNADKKFEAHAWIEYQDRVIIGNLSNLHSFAQIASI